MEGYESKFVFVPLLPSVIHANLLSLVSKTTSHPAPPSALTPSKTLIQTETPPGCPSFLIYHTQKQIMCYDRHH